MCTGDATFSFTTLSFAEKEVPKQEGDWETATTEAGSSRSSSRRPSVCTSVDSDDRFDGPYEACAHMPSMSSSSVNEEAAFHTQTHRHPFPPADKSWSGNVGPRGKSVHKSFIRSSTYGRASSSANSDASATSHSSQYSATSSGTSGNVGPRGKGARRSMSRPAGPSLPERDAEREHTFTTHQDSEGWSGNVGPRGRRSLSASRLGRCGGSGLAAVRAAQYWSGEGGRAADQSSEIDASTTNCERTMRPVTPLDDGLAAFHSTNHSKRHSVGASGSGNIGPRGRGARPLL